MCIPYCQASRVDCFPCITLPGRIALLDPPQPSSGLSLIARFIRRHYAPFLLKPIVKGAVLLAFAGIFTASVISIQHLELGFGELYLHFTLSYYIHFLHRPATRSTCRVLSH